jgi:integrase
MASITTATGSDGKPRYIVNYRDPEGRQRRKTFPKKKFADDFRSTVEADKLRGTYLDADAGRVTFKAYATQWLEAQTFDRSSYEATELRLRLHVFPVLGSMQLRQIKPSTIQALLRGFTMADTYRRVIFANVSAVLAAAVDDELIAKNPCRAGSVKAPTISQRRVVPWTAQQVAALRDALPERYRLAATLASGLGLRQGEVFGLSPDDVDFLRGTVEVRRQVKVFANNRLVFALPKGRKTRTVPLPGSVRDALAEHLANHRAVGVTLPWAEPDSEQRATVSLLLTTRERSALNRNYFNVSVWKKALAVAGVEATRTNGMHALRHWYASVLLDAGESIKALSEYLGHADPGFTLRTYTHLMPASAERTRSAVDAALAVGCYTAGTSQAG